MYNRSLDIFKAVAETGSFSKAAEKLFLTHTAVIKQVNHLEEHFHTKLLVRSPQGIRLTQAGEYLYRETLRVMEHSRKVAAEIQKDEYKEKRILRLGTSALYPCHHFMHLWSRLRKKNLRFQLEIIAFEDDDHRFANLNKRYDFIIGAYDGTIGAGYQFVPLGAYRFCLAMNSSHPLANRKKLTFRNLDGQRLMIMQTGTSPVNDSIRAELVKQYPGVSLIDIPPIYNIRTFNRCAKSNALLLSLECWNHVHPGLTAIPLEEAYTLPYGIITGNGAGTDMEEFIEIIRQAMKKDAGK